MSIIVSHSASRSIFVFRVSPRQVYFTLSIKEVSWSYSVRIQGNYLPRCSLWISHDTSQVVAVAGSIGSGKVAVVCIQSDRTARI